MVRPLECSLAVTAVLLAVVYSLVRLALALRFGNATTAIAMMRMLAGILAVAFWNSYVASVGYVPLLLLAAVIVVSSSHGSPIGSMLCQWACQLGLAISPRGRADLGGFVPHVSSFSAAGASGHRCLP